jgi:spermidine/putrescine transport system substrate-binding protein
MPGEGAVLAVDNMVIHKDAAADLALKFMNFMLEGKNSAELTNLIGWATRTWSGEVHQPRDLEESAIFPDKRSRRSSSSQGTHRRTARLRNRMWTEIKAGR